MNQDTDDSRDPLELLRHELADVKPSPEFEVRVRQQIETAGEPRAASWLPGWRWLVPVAAAAAVVIAVIAISRPNSETPEQVEATAPVAARNRAVAPAETVVPSVPKADGVQVRSTNFELRTSKSARPSAVSAAAENAGPDLTVIADQPAILRAMWARMEVRALVQAWEGVVAEVGEVVIAPLEVSPVVVKWLVEPPLPLPELGALPIIRRVSALVAERSLQ